MAHEASLPARSKDLQSLAQQVGQRRRHWLFVLMRRIGDRPRELGVHVTPTDFNEQQMKEVLVRTKGLWNEKTLARLAVPEMLESVDAGHSASLD
jgi:hypothetical protein